MEWFCLLVAVGCTWASLIIGSRHPHPGVIDLEGAMLAMGVFFAFMAYMLKKGTS